MQVCSLKLGHPGTNQPIEEDGSLPDLPANDAAECSSLTELLRLAGKSLVQRSSDYLAK